MTPARGGLTLAATLTLALSVVIPTTASASLAPPPERQTSAGYTQKDVLISPDLDGDKLPDLLMVHGSTPTGSSTTTLTTTARSGRTGKLLWQRKDSYTSGSIEEYPVARVGAAQKPGVLQVITSNGSGTALTARALDAKGKVLWTYSESGSVGNPVQPAPGFVSLVRTNGHPGLLVVQESFQDVGTGPVDTHLQPEIIDGATGLAHKVGGAFTVDQGFEVVTAGPDLNLDGSDDLFAVEHTTGDSTQTLIARNAATGDQLWTATVPGSQPTLAQVQPVGDVNGDGNPEVSFQGYDEDSTGAYTSLPSTLLDGASGRVLWTRPGFAQAIGGGVQGVVMQTSPVRAYSASGALLWSVAGTPGGLLGEGDVDADRAFDVLATNGSTPQVVSGRTGKVLWSGPAANAKPIGAAVDGHGDDLVAWASTSGGARLVARSGSTGKALWFVTRPGLDARYLEAQGVDVTGDGCADVVIDDGGTAQVLDAADGTLLWSSNMKTGALTAGVKTPKRCVR